MSHVQEQQGMMTLHVTEELDLATAPALRDDVSQALTSRPHTLILDLAGCAFAGVDAVDALVDVTASARRQGTTVLLLGLRPIVRRTISLLGVDDELLVAPSPRAWTAPVRP